MLMKLKLCRIQKSNNIQDVVKKELSLKWLLFRDTNVIHANVLTSFIQNVFCKIIYKQVILRFVNSV